MTIQPTVPAEGAYTEAELAFIENSPPDLWPENQDSNFGQIRKVVTDIVQALIDQIDLFSDESFPATSTNYLSLWEEALNVPIAPSGKTTDQRRTVVAPRLVHGLFTRQRIKDTVEGFITPTFGTAIAFDSFGVAMSAAGVPLLSGSSSLVGAYAIYYDPRNFSYEVWIKNTITPDVASLTKELQRFTPAGVTVAVDNTKANVLDYRKMVKNDQPVWYSQFAGDAVDATGYANNGTLVNPPTALASPGLLVATGNDDSAAWDFDGVNDNITVPHAAQLNVNDNFTLEAWIRPDAIPGAGTWYTILRKQGSFHLMLNSAGQILFTDDADANYIQSNALAVGQTYHIVARRRSGYRSLRINNVENVSTDYGENSLSPAANTTNIVRIGSYDGASQFFNGVIDEPAIYNYVLSDAQVAAHYNAGKNIQT